MSGAVRSSIAGTGEPSEGQDYVELRAKTVSGDIYLEERNNRNDLVQQLRHARDRHPAHRRPDRSSRPDPDPRTAPPLARHRLASSLHRVADRLDN